MVKLLISFYLCDTTFTTRLSCSSADEESTCNVGDPSLIPGSGRSPGEGRGSHSIFLGFPGGLVGQESTCNVGDMGWEGPLEEPGRLQSMGSQRVGHDWATSLSLFTFMHWRRKWQPIPVFLPGESPWTEEPGGLQSMGSQRFRHD